MNAMLLNLGLLPIPKTPKAKRPPNNGQIAMLKRKAAIRRARGERLEWYMRGRGELRRSEISAALGWPERYTNDVLEQLWRDGKVRKVGIGRATRWQVLPANDLGNRRDAGPIGGASVLTDELAGNGKE